VRQAEVVQASIKQRLDADHRQLGGAIVPATMRDAGTMESSTKPARPKAATYRVASGNKAGRTRKCAKSCPDVSRRGRATGSRHARRQVPSATEGWAYLCPWRWLESVVAELVGPVHVAERTGPRRLS
jgi:hypothetical protein